MFCLCFVEGVQANLVNWWPSLLTVFLFPSLKMLFNIFILALNCRLGVNLEGLEGF